MRRISCFLLIVSVLCLQSCLKEEEDVFDQSGAERMADALNKYETILAEAPNGWLMEYYPEPDQAIGGYTFLCAFNSSGVVAVASEIATQNYQPGEPAFSMYKLTADQGPVLSFDTYNEVFHYFSEPSSYDVDGYAGDYEFIILKANQDSVIMKGKKYGNRIVMTPLSAGADWNGYLQQVITISEESAFGVYKLFLGSQEKADVTLSERTFSFEYSEGGEIRSDKVSFIYTNTGVKFYEPFTLGGVTLENFRWNGADSTFVCTDKGVNASLVVSLPEGFLFYSDYIGTWALTYNDGESVKEITISKDVKNKTYVVSGLEFDFLMDYNMAKGTVEITTQEVGTYEGYIIMLCPWSLSSGGYFNYYDSRAGLEGTYSGEPGNIQITFADNGQWDGYDVESFLFYAFTSDGYGAGVFSRYPYVVSMTKQ